MAPADTRHDVTYLGREEFLDEYWRYGAGEHVTLVGKTQSGKTTLAFELLDETTRPRPGVQGIVLVMKPRDPTVADWAKRLGYRRVSSWPPPDSRKAHWRNPRGWVLWPKMGDINADALRCRDQIHKALAESYSKAARTKEGGNRAIFVDEVIGITEELKLGQELNALWMRGSSMGVGLWAATQRPFHAPQHMYNAATHLFLHTDPDKRNRDRFREIGGVDAKLIETITNPDSGYMDEHEFLYVDRRDYSYAIVGA